LRLSNAVVLQSRDDSWLHARLLRRLQPLEPHLLFVLFPELPLEQLRALLQHVGGVRLLHEPLVLPIAHKRSSGAESRLDSNSSGCCHLARC